MRRLSGSRPQATEGEIGLASRWRNASARAFLFDAGAFIHTWPSEGHVTQRNLGRDGKRLLWRKNFVSDLQGDTGLTNCTQIKSYVLEKNYAVHETHKKSPESPE